jgi:hypothetical protein
MNGNGNSSGFFPVCCRMSKNPSIRPGVGLPGSSSTSPRPSNRFLRRG